MKVLFLVPPSPGGRSIIRQIDCSHEAKAAYLLQPFDYLLISALLRPDDEAALVDGTAGRLTEEAFLRRLEPERPDLVFLALSSVCWDWDYRLFEEVRRRFPDTPLYVLGDVFLEDSYLELILPRCEGVVFIPHLLDLPAMAARARRGNVELPGLRQPAALRGAGPKKALRAPVGVPRHELFQDRGYAFPFARHARFATVTIVWSCPFSCSYCTQRSIPPVIRPAAEVVRELEHLAALGIRELFFADKSFGFPRREVEPLLELMRGRFRFSWSCYFHPQMYRPELLERMAAAGCHTIIVGLESADPAGLARYGRRVEPERIARLLEHAGRLGLEVCADFIIGLEHESESDIRRTIDYAVGLPIDFASFNVAAPLPGTALRERLVAAGRMPFGREGYDSLGGAGVMASAAVPAARILALRREAVRRFYLRPGRLWRRLRRTASLEHLVLQGRQMAALLRKS
jgi:hypothetical protein